MAFPAIATSANSTEDVDTTSHTVNLPASIASGDTLIATVITDGAPTQTWPTGWVLLEDEHPTSSVRGQVRYREADGTEGASITVTTSASEKSAHIVYRITGAEDPDTQAPESSGTGTTTSTPNPPSLTPTGGAADFLWLAIMGNDHSRTVSSYPTNYTDGEQFIATPNAGSACAAARRNLNASSENPGTFTISASDQTVSFTVAIHPASAVTERNWPWKVIDPPLGVQYRRRQ